MARSQSRSNPPAAPRAPKRASHRRAAGGTLLGIFIGLVIGLALAAGVAFYLMGGRSVYQAQVNAQKDVREPARDAPAAVAADNKPRFDFYKILPGGEEPKAQSAAKADVRPDRSVAEKARDQQSADKGAAKPGPKPAVIASLPDNPANTVTPAVPRTDNAKDRFWLQAGSFTDEADAENLKAQLALAGWQASVQRGTLPDKSVRFRVRLGPYDNGEELSRVKNQLAQRGYDAAAIRY